MNVKVKRILIADDHGLIRQGLKTILGFESNIKVIGEAINGEEAIKSALALQPDVVLLDVNMPDMTGLEVLKQIKASNETIHIIMITADGDRDTLFAALDADADGYILKDSESVDLIQAIEDVSNGESYIDKRLMKLLISKVKVNQVDQSNKLNDLTPREISVLRLIAQGYSNIEVSDALFLSEKTIKNYATSIFKKLEVKDRVQATLYAIKHGIEDF